MGAEETKRAASKALVQVSKAKQCLADAFVFLLRYCKSNGQCFWNVYDRTDLFTWEERRGNYVTGVDQSAGGVDGASWQPCNIR